MQPTTSSGAAFSRCRKYRYRLWRRWDKDKPVVTFVMLNPSQADASVNDPTIRRCMGFARNWGFGGIVVVNLYAYRTSSPKILMKQKDPEGPKNRYHLRKALRSADIIVCAWGNRKGAPPISWRQQYQILSYIELSKDGTPKHPLYLKKNLRPKNFC